MVENIEQIGATGILAAVCFALLDLLKSYVKQVKAKRNGGTTYTRLAMIESSQRDLEEALKGNQQKLASFHRDFLEFREEVRVNIAEQRVRTETLREIKNG
jgi:hypothetical protein